MCYSVCKSRSLRFDGVVKTVFFFSSRRRHTRLVSDWSSDVCSSDLSGDPLIKVFLLHLSDQIAVLGMYHRQCAQFGTADRKSVV